MISVTLQRENPTAQDLQKLLKEFPAGLDSYV